MISGKKLPLEIIGHIVKGIYYESTSCKLTIILDNSKSLTFHNCIIAFDGGIVGKTINKIYNYAGEIGLVLEIKKKKLNPDDFYYCTISGEETEEFYINKIRLVYSDIEYLDN